MGFEPCIAMINEEISKRWSNIQVESFLVCVEPLPALRPQASNLCFLFPALFQDRADLQHSKESRLLYKFDRRLTFSRTKPVAIGHRLRDHPENGLAEY